MSSVKTSNRPGDNSVGSSPSVAEKLSSRSPKSAAPKQVRLKLVYIDFWSSVKLSFLLSAAVGIVLVVAVLLIWLVLASTGVFDQINQLAADVSGSKSFSISTGGIFAQVLGFTFVIAALGVVVGTVLGAIACVLYNLSVRITGGILVGFTNQ